MGGALAVGVLGGSATEVGASPRSRLAVDSLSSESDYNRQPLGTKHTKLSRGMAELTVFAATAPSESPVHSSTQASTTALCCCYFSFCFSDFCSFLHSSMWTTLLMSSFLPSTKLSTTFCNISCLLMASCQHTKLCSVTSTIQRTIRGTHTIQE